MKENKTYTAADLERYHTGSMPASEMHALEKAALEDPFLADALEGYGYSSSAKNDIQELRQKLFEKERNKNKTPVYSIKRNVWWRIAALFVIVAGASIIFYKINLTSKQNAIAKTGDEVSLKADSSDSLSNAEKAPSQGIVAFENSAAAKPGENKITPLPGIKVEADKKRALPSSPKRSAGVSDVVVVGYGTQKKANLTGAVAEPEGDMARVAVSDENKKSFVEYALKGKVTDQEGNPLAAASVKEKHYDVIVATDSSGNFSIRSSDSNANAIVSAAGYATKMVALQKDSQPVIAMDKSDGAVNEALLASADRSKAARQKQMESRTLETKMKSAAPVTSNPQFDEYVKTHIKPVYDEDRVRQTGDVKLSFTVGKEGKPENIKIDNSTCKACEGQAIELLKNGPLWTHETSTEKMVLIKF